MKLTNGLSSIALVLLVNTAPCFALNQSSQGLIPVGGAGSIYDNGPQHGTSTLR